MTDTFLHNNDGSLEIRTKDYGLGDLAIVKGAYPIDSDGFVTKSYVDAAVTGLFANLKVKASSVYNVDISSAVENGDDLDGVLLETGDIILLRHQTNPYENGLYEISEKKSPKRYTGSITNDLVIFVENGGAHKNKFFKVNGSFSGSGGEFVYGSDTINFNNTAVFPTKPVGSNGSDATVIDDSNIAANADISLNKLSPIASNKVVISNSSGVLSPGACDAGQLTYLTGLNQNIQTKFNTLDSSDQTIRNSVSDINDSISGINGSLNNIDTSITNINGTLTNLAASNGSVLSQLSTKLDKTGGTVTGLISYSGTNFSNDNLVNKAYVDSNILSLSGTSSGLLSSKLDLTGGTVTGQVFYNGTPTTGSSFVNKSYVDTTVQNSFEAGAGLQLSSGSFNVNVDENNIVINTTGSNANKISVGQISGNQVVGGTLDSIKVVGLSAPTTSDEAANKGYVDSVVGLATQGLLARQSARVATTGNIVLSGLQTIDGVVLEDDDRVLVKDQLNPIENGIYVASGTSWSRATDMDVPAEVKAAFAFVEEGSQGGKGFVVVGFTEGDMIGSDPITWTQFSQAGAYTASGGVTLTDGEFSLTSVGTGGVYNQVQVNTKGQVTSGSNIPYLTQNQTITLSGDISGTGGTSINATLGSNVVSYGKIQKSAGGKVLLGAGTANNNISEIALGSYLDMAGGTLSVVNLPSFVSSVVAGAGLTGGTITGNGTISLSNSGVTAGTYNQVVVDTYGRVTSASSVSNGTGSVTSVVAGTDLSGGTITGSGTLNLATQSSVVTGTYGGTASVPVVVVNNKGIITNISTSTISIPSGTAVTVAAGTNTTVGTATVGSSTTFTVNVPSLGITSVIAGDGLTGGTITGTGTIALGTSGVTAGTYDSGTKSMSIIVDAYGRVTSLSSGTSVLGTGSVTKIVAGSGLTGGTITGTGTIALGTTGVTAGTYNQLVVDTYGRATSGASVSYITSADTVWNKTKTYAAGDVVFINGAQFIANGSIGTNITSVGTDGATWKPATANNYLGTYAKNTSYKIGDMFSLGYGVASPNYVVFAAFTSSNNVADTDGRAAFTRDITTPGGVGVGKAYPLMHPAAVNYYTEYGMVGATGTSAGVAGNVPGPSSGQQNAFLTGGGIWKKMAAVQSQLASSIHVNYAAHTKLTNFSSASVDNTGNWDAANGVFTAPYDGLYQASGGLLFTNGSWGATGLMQMSVWKGGTSVPSNSTSFSGTSALWTQMGLGFNAVQNASLNEFLSTTLSPTIISLAAGEKICFAASQNMASGGKTTLSSPMSSISIIQIQ